jgi:integrase
VLVHDARVKDAGKYGTIGWHTFRPTDRSWLDETGDPMKVQQELMRHASIQTTMNVYAPQFALRRIGLAGILHTKLCAKSCIQEMTVI